jgi:SAM-dependent methyltransferase
MYRRPNLSWVRFETASGTSDSGFSTNDYRTSHVASDAGRIYNRTYETGYYAALWAKVEKPLLEATLREAAGPHRKCLDFACGTGRIASVAAEFYAEVVGVDVSKPMLACAHVPGNVRLYCVDMTVHSLRETFDAVTAFRFFLNAEQRLRREALKAIRSHLNANGVLVCNIHMNASSPMGIATRIASRIPRSRERNTMSVGEFSTLLTSVGFTIEQIIPYGYLPRPGSLLPGVCEACVEPAERIAKVLTLPGRFAQNFLVVARRRPYLD